MKKPLIIIAGPTACGKTAVSVRLAEKVGGEIISADSMQVYKYMDIGTAKVTEKEKKGIPHYLIDELFPDEEYSAAVFQKKAKEYYKLICSKNKVPILVGGTGFYINAFVKNNDFEEMEIDLEYRNELWKIAEEKGGKVLFDMLEKCDVKSCETIHPNNIKKVIRALEYYRQTGTPISAHNAEEKLKVSPYDTVFIVLNMDRKLLYERIDMRVDSMIEMGLVQEVENLLKNYSPNLVSMQGLGYKEIVRYLNGEISLEEAVFILKRDTRHFAKRQLTWFRRQCEAVWIDVGDGNAENAADKICDIYYENRS